MTRNYDAGEGTDVLFEIGRNVFFDTTTTANDITYAAWSPVLEPTTAPLLAAVLVAMARRRSRTKRH